ncbi:hypothetical protein LCGC14_2346000 [marine sediment metagenome]|uniref:Uncharacterized protein n=1 Tax=marine sediment metagenome TaxID=412755 RepID=A0A0F9CAI5_9ZZZZ
MVNKQVGIVVFTAVEVVTLVVWLIFALEASDALFSILAVLVLIGGLTLEHLITYNVIHKRSLFDFRGLPVGQKAVVSLIETGIWVVWLVIARQDIAGGFEHIIAAVVLFGLLIIEHTISDNVFTGRKLFERLADKRTIGFSIVEAAGAAIWLVLIDVDLAILGVIVLAIASFLEHNLAVNLALREDPQQLR